MHIEQREREIKEAKKEIEEIKRVKSGQQTELNSEINELKKQAQEINEQIKAKEKTFTNINSNKIPEVDDIIKEYLLPIKKPRVLINPVAKLKAYNVLERIKHTQISTTPAPNLQESMPIQKEQAEIDKVKKRVPKWFNSPNQANHKILVTYLKLLGEDNSVQMDELQKACSEIVNFQKHYNAMKYYGERNHGKVFDENNKDIFLWEPVKDFIENEYNKFQKD